MSGINHNVLKKSMVDYGALVALIAATLLLAACASQPAEPEIPETGAEISGYSDLVETLQNREANVEEAGQVDQPFFEVDARMIRLNGQDVQVFEFPDEASRQTAAETIAPSAATVGEIIPEWVDKPHFWAEGRVIVLYVGQNEETINLLTDVLGTPIAEGEAVFGPPQGTVQPEAVVAAVSQLAESLGVDLAQVQVVSFQAMEWPDACLGLPQPDEVCAQVITPGFQVIVEVNGQQHEIRTDETGSIIRINQSVTGG